MEPFHEWLRGHGELWVCSIDSNILVCLFWLSFLERIWAWFEMGKSPLALLLFLSNSLRIFCLEEKYSKIGTWISSILPRFLPSHFFLRLCFDVFAQKSGVMFWSWFSFKLQGVWGWARNQKIQVTWGSWAYSAVTSLLTLGWQGTNKINKHLGDYMYWMHASSPRDSIILFNSCAPVAWFIKRFRLEWKCTWRSFVGFISQTICWSRCSSVYGINFSS